MSLLYKQHIVHLSHNFCLMEVSILERSWTNCFNSSSPIRRSRYKFLQSILAAIIAFFWTTLKCFTIAHEGKRNIPAKRRQKMKIESKKQVLLESNNIDNTKYALEKVNVFVTFLWCWGLRMWQVLKFCTTRWFQAWLGLSEGWFRWGNSNILSSSFLSCILHFLMFIRTFSIPVNFVMFALLFQYKKVCHEFQLDPTLHFATYWRIYLFLDLNLSSWRLIMSPNEEYLFYSPFTVLILLLP